MAKVDSATERGPKETATEVFVLVRDYAKQETVDPLLGLLRYAKWGLVGAVVVGFGAIELMVAVLRLIQTEGDDAMDGRLSFIPYAVTLVLAGVVLLLTRRAMKSKKVPVS